jgi:hypothetical protein
MGLLGAVSEDHVVEDLALCLPTGDEWVWKRTTI